MQRYDVDQVLHELAERAGLELVPAVYDLQFTDGVQVNMQRLTPDPGDGPFIVTRLTEQFAVAAADTWELELTTGGRRITDGRVPFRTTWGLLSFFSTGVLVPIFSPTIFIDRGESLVLQADAGAGNSILGGNHFSVEGYHLRKRGGRERVGGEADAFAQFARAHVGEAYMLGLRAAAAQTSFALSHAAEWLMASVSVLAGAPSAVSLRIDQLELFPRRSRLFNDTNVSAAQFHLGHLASKRGALAEWRVDSGTAAVTLMGRAFRGG